ncbi:MAG: aspartyl/asparaginyl beta-hydroxylase domain-containing protein [Okeania sp. SIO3B5]|uniref:aspartyl/asparaginyl beta-hydroxylase domain-containing protein n=1 Tax=Okeania sp. SIO3B5 TaxID=2607811 RepID=UPI0013FF4351|nr:aspartyl/asparaginyl beta-hydroxylase domain-containing protein [Okeania sp. SIO3B5]NEO55359.1 aspartyl/asparaginyl beta-hydroxylase domain-containing protein [Okeania sp. SIO3B5]
MVNLSLETIRAKFRRILIYGIGVKLLGYYEKLIPKYSLIGDTAFFDPKQFDWTTEVEANWVLIRKELDELLKYRDNLPNFQDISPDQADYTSPDDLWKTFFMYGYGIKSEKNCQRCPETTRLIEKIPGMKTAFFSILLPGKHIPEHRGPYKGVVRYLLALKVPEPKEKCRIRVGDETRNWEEGKSMMFDDSFPHEAWNETDGVRVVLFLDIMRPMRFPLSVFNELFMKLIAISPYIQDANINQKHWADRLEKLFAQEREKEKV